MQPILNSKGTSCDRQAFASAHFLSRTATQRCGKKPRGNAQGCPPVRFPPHHRAKSQIIQVSLHFQALSLSVKTFSMSKEHFHPPKQWDIARVGSLFVAMVVLGGFIGIGHAETTPPSLPLSIPFDFENNQVYLRVGINNHEPAWFVLDSGASACVIDTTMAKRLGLATHGDRRGSGAGKGTFEITFTDNVTYDLAGLHVTMPQTYVIDLSGQPAIFGREIAGILGYDFFTRYVIAVDYDAAVLTLFSATTVVPFTLVKKTPHITVHVTVADRLTVRRGSKQLQISLPLRDRL